MYRRKPRDEEEQLLEERALLLQHKQELELQQAMFGPANRPSHLPIQIGRLQDEIRRIDRRITYARRKKRLKATMQQVATAGQTVTDAVLPPIRGSRASRRRSGASSLAGVLIIGLIIIGVVAGIGRLRPGLSGSFAQAEAAPLAGEMISEPTAVTLPTIAPVQETAMALGAWPPPDVERRVIGATGGIGVKLRVDPHQESHSFITVPDNTTVYLINKMTDSAGAIWWWVALSDGTTGYIKDQYLLTP